jgi:hypothetical protein
MTEENIDYLQMEEEVKQLRKRLEDSVKTSNKHFKELHKAWIKNKRLRKGIEEIASFTACHNTRYFLKKLLDGEKDG